MVDIDWDAYDAEWDRGEDDALNGKPSDHNVKEDSPYMQGYRTQKDYMQLGCPCCRR